MIKLYVIERVKINHNKKEENYPKTVRKNQPKKDFRTGSQIEKTIADPY